MILVVNVGEILQRRAGQKCCTNDGQSIWIPRNKFDIGFG